MYEIDWIATMGYFVCSGVFELLILLGVVIVCVIKNHNSSEDEECISDKEFKEAFIKDYIDSDGCILVKINSLTKSFKIGNVYFDKCVDNSRHYETFLSYVIVDGKAYDNGILSIDFECNYTGGDKEYNFSCNTSNRDLLDYVLDNLDKVEEVNND